MDFAEKSCQRPNPDRFFFSRGNPVVDKATKLIEANPRRTQDISTSERFRERCRIWYEEACWGIQTVDETCFSCITTAPVFTVSEVCCFLQINMNLGRISRRIHWNLGQAACQAPLWIPNMIWVFGQAHFVIWPRAFCSTTSRRRFTSWSTWAEMVGPGWALHQFWHTGKVTV